MPDQDYNPDTNLPVDVGPGDAAPPEDFETVVRQRDEYRDLASARPPNSTTIASESSASAASCRSWQQPI